MGKRDRTTTHPLKTSTRHRRRTTSSVFNQFIESAMQMLRVEFTAKDAVCRQDSGSFPYANNSYYLETINAKITGQTMLVNRMVNTKPKSYVRHVYLKLEELGRSNQSMVGALALKTSGQFLKCPWCILYRLETTIHEDYCTCVDLHAKTCDDHPLVEEIFFNDTNRFVKHILDRHTKKVSTTMFTSPPPPPPKGRRRRNACTKANMLMDTTTWTQCPFSDCAIRLKSPRLLLNHLARRHSQALSCFVPTNASKVLKALGNQLLHPLGIKATFMTDWEKCVEINPSMKGSNSSYLGCTYTGSTEEQFITSTKSTNYPGSTEERFTIDTKLTTEESFTTSTKLTNCPGLTEETFITSTKSTFHSLESPHQYIRRVQPSRAGFKRSFKLR